jgi:signal peptidase II
MFKINLKKNIKFLFLVGIIFFLDRYSKIYVLNLAEMNNSVDVYLTSYLNLYLIWNKGIAFGLFSSDQNIIYNLVTTLIGMLTLIILYIITKTKDFRVYFFILIVGGALGNLYDRLYYSAVPDFIDFHINNFHWFIFNVADIFISIGVLCLILAEFFYNKNETNEKK